MDFNFSAEQLAARDLARDFARKTLAPTVAEDERAHRFRLEHLKAMAELGFYGAVIPEAHGGNGLGFLASCLMAAEVAKVHAAYGVTFNMQTTGPGLSLLRWGNEEQKRRFIPGLVSGDIRGCFAISEPDAASDVGAMKTRAVLEGDQWVLNGVKTWISHAQIADMGIVFAVTDPERGVKGISAFAMPLKIAGVSHSPMGDKLGLHSSPTGMLHFDDARIPSDCLLGPRGEGFKVCMTLLDHTRLSCAARALGVAEACFEAARDYAVSRRQFGKPVASFQMVQADLATMHTEIEAARWLVYKAAWEKDQDPFVRNTVSVSQAKGYAADVVNRAADLGMRIFGSYGFSAEYPMERLFRDAKSFHIVEGTHNIQKLIVAKSVLPADLMG